MWLVYYKVYCILWVYRETAHACFVSLIKSLRVIFYPAEYHQACRDVDNQGWRFGWLQTDILHTISAFRIHTMNPLHNYNYEMKKI